MIDYFINNLNFIPKHGRERRILCKKLEEEVRKLDNEYRLVLYPDNSCEIYNLIPDNSNMFVQKSYYFISIDKMMLWLKINHKKKEKVKL